VTEADLAKWKAAISACHAAQRRGRVRYPAPPIVGVVKLPPSTPDNQAESRTESRRVFVSESGVSSAEGNSGTESGNQEMEENPGE
jgi:hypothetical protein